MLGRMHELPEPAVSHSAVEVDQHEFRPLLLDADTLDEQHMASDSSSQPPTTTILRLHPLERPPVASQRRGELEGFEDEQPVAPDQFLEGYETSRWEIWSYYAYYVGDNGMGLFQFAPAAFQNLLAQKAGAAGVLPFAGRLRTINSIVLLSNGLSFSIQVPLFLILGSFADFGTWRSSILIVQTTIGVAIGFAWLGVHVPSKWEYGAALYIVGCQSKFRSSKTLPPPTQQTLMVQQ